MAISVNTNLSALTAARILTNTNDSLDKTQKRVSSGFTIADAFDNGAIYAIAQNVRSDLSGISAVNGQLGGGLGAIQVANTAVNSISNKMADMRKTLTQLADGNVAGDTRTQLELQYSEQMQSLVNFAHAADYNGTNLVSNGTNYSIIRDALGNQLAITAVATQVVAAFSALSIAVTGGFTSAASMLNQTLSFATAESNIGTALNRIGVLNMRLSDQIRYNEGIEDAFKAGLSSLIDADLTVESATLTSLQIKQQLSSQSLSIANQRPQILLSLFGG
ncbi:flagellin [Lacibacterium aquatile]|uniref:Flagellin n=1 Tax=Lacibacterium aquatile TaxID=1168082 RepID=A0ABW5DT26_9PROT